MKISWEELAARLAAADRLRALLRRATLELRALARDRWTAAIMSLDDPTTTALAASETSHGSQLS